MAFSFLLNLFINQVCLFFIRKGLLTKPWSEDGHWYVKINIAERTGVSPPYCKGLRDFPDREDLEAGDEISDATKEAISRALVHIAIFDPGYANCPRCIDELKLMLQTDKKIIPIFDHVEPYVLRWVAQKGVYYEAFSELEKKGIYPPQKLEEWKIALSKASEISGHKFNDYENDQGLLVDKIVSNVRDEIKAAYGKYPVFINNRGIDVKNSLASIIYHTLKSIGVGSFLDTKELKPGEKFPDAINEAISGALIHIAIFSPNYAQSSWCLNELTRMLQSGKKIIPIFYNVNPCDLKLVAEGKGVYSTAFSKHEKDGRYPLEKLDEWKMALSKASAISGYEVNQREKNEGLLLKEIVENVMKEMRSAYGRYPFFINHCGIDVENSLASIIYRILNIILAQDFPHSGQSEAGDCRDFLDREQLEAGDWRDFLDREQSEAGDCRDFLEVGGERPLMRAEDWRYFVDRQADRY